MKRIIVAMGGGERPHTRSDGSRAQYQLINTDRELVRLCAKAKPHVAYVANAQPDADLQQKSFRDFSQLFTNRLKCVCKMIGSETLKNGSAKDILKWADIVWVGGGDTVAMIKEWRESGFDAALREAYDTGTILSGASAGANCWFEYYCTDSFHDGGGLPGISDGLGFIPGMFCPHFQDAERLMAAQKFIDERPDVTAYAATDGAGFIFEDGERRGIFEDEDILGFEAQTCVIDSN